MEESGSNLNGYWIVRNSWGVNWPKSTMVESNKKLQGYFCLAMHPTNMLVQLAHPFQMSAGIPATLTTPARPAVGQGTRWYSKLLAANPKLAMFSMFVGMSAGNVCSDECDKKLKILPANVRNPFFSKLEAIKKGSKTTLLGATHSNVGQLAEWSGYLSNNPTVYTKQSETYVTGNPTHWHGPTPPGPPTPGHPPGPPTPGGMSNTVIVIIIASAVLLLSIVAYWLIRRGRRKGGRK
jgi:hypothetical protein